MQKKLEYFVLTNHYHPATCWDGGTKAILSGRFSQRSSTWAVPWGTKRKFYDPCDGTQVPHFQGTIILAPLIPSLIFDAFPTVPGKITAGLLLIGYEWARRCGDAGSFTHPEAADKQITIDISPFMLKKPQKFCPDEKSFWGNVYIRWAMGRMPHEGATKHNMVGHYAIGLELVKQEGKKQ